MMKSLYSHESRGSKPREVALAAILCKERATEVDCCSESRFTKEKPVLLASGLLLTSAGLIRQVSLYLKSS